MGETPATLPTLLSCTLRALAIHRGQAMGRMLGRLLDGTNASYDELLEAAEATDTLRVVDGELDNEFSPDRHAIRMTPR